MTISPHPNVLAVVAAQRRAELLALADREQQARRAAGDASPRRPGPGLLAAVMIAVALTLLEAQG